jgi:oligosaccharyltransferase complex subunit gamma
MPSFTLPTIHREFAPDYEIVARSYRDAADKSVGPPIYFANLDFNNGREIFQRLAVSAAPTAFVHMPTTGKFAASEGNPVNYDFNREGLKGEDFTRFMARLFGKEFPLQRPIDLLNVAWVGATGFGGFVGLCIIIKYARDILASRRLWAAFSLVIILMMTTGHMWNQIRNPNYISQGQHGEPQYFTGGFQDQNGIESQIISGVYALLSFATIALITRAPAMEGKTSRMLSVYFWTAVIVGTYSLLLAIFRIKNGGYPFRLFI